ncbi:MAG: Zn-ribbon domain-containing OB-fold protein [Acetobacteraceae bacterium]
MPQASTSPLATYLDHLKKGELAYQFSPSLNAAVFYPRVIAPKTGKADLEWRVSKGLGTVHATTVNYPQQGEPYNVCLVDMDEGFRLMSRVEGIPALDVRIGMRVKFHVHNPGGDEDPYPVFTVVEGA